MNNRYIYASLLSAAALGLFACDEDYQDWAAPQAYEQEAAAPKVNGSMQAVNASIDFANLDDDFAIVTIKSSDSDAQVYVNALFVNGAEVVANVDGEKVLVNKNDLQVAVQQATKSQAQQTLDLNVEVQAFSRNADGVSSPIEIAPVTVSYKTAAPDETLASLLAEDEFFYIGTAEGWSYESVLPFTNNGDGTHTLVLKVDDKSEYFKLASKSAVASADWSNLLGCAVDGSTATADFLVANGQSMLIEDGGTFTFTIDTKNMTYSITPYSENVYYAGDANKWSFSPMSKIGEDFVGFYFVKAVVAETTYGFKICTANNWDQPQYGQGESAGLVALGGGNIDLGQKDGFYKITFSQANLTVALEEITSVGIVGDAAGSWDTDLDLTFNEKTMAWEGTFDLVAGPYKFRANHAWAINWGGDANALTVDGANLNIDAAGNYSFSLQPNANGLGTVSVTKN